MKFNFLKFKNKNLPSLKSLRPPIFNIDSYWFFSLGVFFALLVFMALVGFKLFYSQYFEDYKEITVTENSDDPINVSKLKSVIEKRNYFINRETVLPPDPSL